MPELVSSPIVQFSILFFMSGLLYGILTGRIEFRTPLGTFGGKKDK